jgi:AcrR family transcriptional regulator
MHSERGTKAGSPAKTKSATAKGAPEPRTATILNAAERMFGTHGYDGASMRTIAEEAGVAQALLHYHYSTKDNLYAAVFERRSSAITAHRGAQLDALFASDRTPLIEDVLTILFTPLSDIFHGEDADNLALYVQMVVSISLGADERSVRLREEYYDPIAERIIDALHAVIPGISRQDAVWAYLFSIGARQQAHALNGRAAKLGAPQRAGNAIGHYSQLVRFASAGIRSLVENSATSTPMCKPRKVAGSQA